MIYLDHNATTPLAPEARAAMEPWLGDRPANPSAVHLSGQQAREAVEEARREVGALLDAEAAGVVFTSGGTESDNAALWAGVGWPPAGRLLVSAVEHPAVLETAARLQHLGVAVELLAVGADGIVDPGIVADALDHARDDAPRLVSVMAANNEVGSLQPVAAIGALCREAGVLFHCDAVQAAAWVDLAPLAAVADLVTLTAHKIGGPPGIGALWVRPGLDVEPLVRGGSQQGGRRAGTEPTALAAGFGAACRRVRRGRAGQATRVAALRDRLEKAVVETVGGARRTLPAGTPRLPSTAHLCLDRCDGNALVARLDVDGLGASAGSACASGVAHPSHVLTAMGVDAGLQGGALRLSLGYDTRDDEIDAAARIVAGGVAALRRAGVEAVG